MKLNGRAPSMAILATLLASCGGGDGASPTFAVGQAVSVVSGGSTPTATPTPAPTPTPSPTSSPTPDISATNQAAGKDTVANRTVLTDRMFYSQGSLIAYASPWCTLYTDKLVVGVDLVNSISLVPSAFPNDTIISTKAPMDNPNLYGCGVYGYVHLAYGNYDSGVPKVAVAPVQVSAMRSSLIDFNVTRGNSTGEYNILNEFYLTSAPGASDDKVVEIGFFLHPSATAIAFAKTGQIIGTFRDSSGRSWNVARVGKFIMLFPEDGGDVLSGTLDIKQVLTFLIGKGEITGKEWLNGMAIGVEPVRGQANVTINRWAVSLS